MKNIQEIIEEQQANLKEINSKKEGEDREKATKAWMIQLASGLLKFLREETLKTDDGKDYTVALKRVEDAVRAIPKTEKVSVQNFESVIRALDDLKSAVKGIKFPEINIPETKIPDTVKVSNLKDIKFPEIKIPEFPQIPEVDFSVLIKEVKNLEKSILASTPKEDTQKNKEQLLVLNKIEQTLQNLNEKMLLVASKEYPTPEDRTEDILKGLKDVSKTITEIKFPVPIVNTSAIADAIANMSIGVDTTGLATEAKQDDIISAIGEISVANSPATNFAFYGSTDDEDYDYVAKQAADGKWYIMRINKTTGSATYAVGDSDLATAWAAVASQDYDVWDNHNHPTATIAESSNSTIYGKTSDSTYQVPRIDASTHSLQVIDYEHHEIHGGSAYFYTDSVELGNAGVQDYLLTTPDTTAWAHLTFQITGSAITQVQVYEAAGKSGTTAQTTQNHNRNSANTSGLTIHKGTSGSGDGTLIWQRKSGSAQGQSRTGVEATHTGEIILKQNTKYIFRITSGTAANLTNALFDWYEHTNRTA